MDNPNIEGLVWDFTYGYHELPGECCVPVQADDLTGAFLGDLEAAKAAAGALGCGFGWHWTPGTSLDLISTAGDVWVCRNSAHWGVVEVQPVDFDE
jgi:hypothetical protein